MHNPKRGGKSKGRIHMAKHDNQEAANNLTDTRVNEITSIIIATKANPHYRLALKNTMAKMAGYHDASNLNT
jgi:hypothetical protein